MSLRSGLTGLAVVATLLLGSTRFEGPPAPSRVVVTRDKPAPAP
jgi:hypothetical protein